MFGCLVIFFPNLPAAIGLKSFAVGISCGYCLTSYQDGGWSDDPEMAPHENSPLGKLVMPILVRLLVSTPELANQLAGSGVKIAMDNYPIILHLFSFSCVCSIKYKSCVVGTVRRNHNLWSSHINRCLT